MGIIFPKRRLGSKDPVAAAVPYTTAVILLLFYKCLIGTVLPGVGGK